MEFDIIIKNGFVVDGCGNPYFKADIGIQGERIKKIGRLEKSQAEVVIDATGQIVCPGFIDPHTHSDRTIFINPRRESFVRQGITTEICGNCGISPAPLTDQGLEFYKSTMASGLVEEISWDWRTMGEYFAKVEKQGTSINFACYVGHSTIRADVMGWEMRKPTESELEEMKRLVAQAMEDGALGLSSGLYYSPGGFADTDELIELAKVVAKYGGVYHTHIRGESAMVLDSVKEAITIGEKANVPVIIAHHKAYGSKYWPLINRTLKAMDEARERGVEVSCNVYGYTFGQTSFDALLPYWAHEGGPKKLIERLKDPATRERIKKDMQEGVPGWESHVKATGWETIVIAEYPDRREYEGKSIAEIAKDKGVDPYDLALDFMLEAAKGAWMFILVYGQGEEDRRLVLKHHLSMIGSDAWALAPYGILSRGKNHPRMYGCYPQILGQYVREWKVLTLEEAIRKMTSFPASQHRIFDRGILREGFFADVVIFDPKTVKDMATLENPYVYPTGINYVIVNGKIAVKEGEHTGVLAGKILRLNRKDKS